jgi:hypothetical protein
MQSDLTKHHKPRTDTKINFNRYHEFFKIREILAISFTGMSSRQSDRLVCGIQG